MSFKSNTSKKQAESTVAKLFASVLPSSKVPSASKENQLSSTQLLSNQFTKTASVKPKKRSVATANKIKKQSEQDKKFKRMIKYNIIKNHEDHTPEEAKYLAKLRRKNINQIKNLSNIDDDNISQELEELRSSLLTNELIAKQQKTRVRGKLLGEKIVHKKHEDFDRRIKSGMISYPGLTPGLAPVDYDESDSE